MGWPNPVGNLPNADFNLNVNSSLKSLLSGDFLRPEFNPGIFCIIDFPDAALAPTRDDKSVYTPAFKRSKIGARRWNHFSCEWFGFDGLFPSLRLSLERCVAGARDICVSSVCIRAVWSD